ncbi:MAG: hypothetical protein H7070_11375 [Saprospiraceae bacterium]|nr:hypothetical protein [Pyrinomonadaceae bacterium]
MNLFSVGTKVFAVLLLFFANFSLTSGQDDSIYLIKSGTRIHLRMDSEISSKVASAGDTFTATAVDPLLVRNSIMLPSGTVFEGRVISVSGASTGGKGGQIELLFETIRLDNGQERKIDGVLVNDLKAESSKTVNMVSILGGTAIGLVFGTITGGDNGSLIGAAVGAGAGTGVALLRKGKNVRIKTGEEFDIELRKDVVLPVRDY